MNDWPRNVSGSDDEMVTRGVAVAVVQATAKAIAAVCSSNLAGSVKFWTTGNRFTLDDRRCQHDVIRAWSGYAVHYLLCT